MARVQQLLRAAMRHSLWLSLLAACAAPRQVISTTDAPAAIGPYSQGVRVGDTLWVAGQIGRDPLTNALASESITTETHRALQNLGAILTAAGFAFQDVVQVQVFLTDLADFEAMNAVYATYFPAAAPPARATVQVAALPKNARVEVMVVAVRAGR
jgi:2-iminobutanoate/2-iminopropanoate deaminase